MRLVKVVQSSALIKHDYMMMFLCTLGSVMFVMTTATIATALSTGAPCVGNTCRSGFEYVHRKPIVAGNWKMNSNFEDSSMLATQVVYLTKDLKYEDIVVAIFPPFPLLQSVQQAVAGSAQQMRFGAQTVFYQPKGAYTGAVSASMLKSLECEYVLVGHSERRSVFKETDEEINRSLRQVLENEMVPILCVGETLDQYESGRNKEVITHQLQHGLAGLEAQDVANLIVAYEPVWAIGTGKVATPAIAQDVHATIRAWLSAQYGADAAQQVRILYGGSVTPDSVEALVRSPDIDGALVGGASLDARAFAKIANTVNEVFLTKGLQE